ncbi:MAG: YidC/Oxa1 family membrane protein insertase [Chloroflexi bacterium]|nr:YidC/Oxa1 family membrane protein insertase [Chloroflexota bacterium]
MSLRRILAQPRPAWLGPTILLALVALVVAGCLGGGPTLAPGQTPTPTPAPTQIPPLVPDLKPDPFSLLSWLFTPIFQTLLIILIVTYRFTPDIGVAIIVMTLIVRTLLVPLFRRQMVSTRRMQGIQPELAEIKRRYKGDARKQNEATMALYRERGISQSGCLAALLPLLIIIPMYTVIQSGLQHYDPTPMLRPFGLPLDQWVGLQCPTGDLLPNGLRAPCLETEIPWLFGLDAHLFHIDFFIPVIEFGISYLAIVYTLLSLIASRMALPPHDPGKPLDAAARSQRNTMLIVPVISVLYSGIIPVGLFLYLLVSTVYQIIQQFLTTGWGSMFPLFGWMPAFAVDHQPRFPIPSPPAQPSGSGAGGEARPNPARPIDRAASAAATIRPKGRTSRRGRRR